MVAKYFGEKSNREFIINLPMESFRTQKSEKGRGFVPRRFGGWGRCWEGREMVGGKESHPYKEVQLYIYAVQ
jgi:hypothetical protein